MSEAPTEEETIDTGCQRVSKGKVVRAEQAARDE